MEAIRTLFGTRVRALREAKGWELDDLAARLGKSRSSMSRIENGKQNLTLGAIAAIAVALEVAVPVLFGGVLEDRQLSGVAAIAAQVEQFVSKFGETAEEAARLAALVGVPIVVTVSRPTPDTSLSPERSHEEPLLYSSFALCLV